MPAKQARSRGGRLGFLSLCLLLLAWTGCEPETCTASAECAAGQLCGGAGTGPYHCLADCTDDGKCASGFQCVGVTSADCPVCQVVTNACIADPPHLLWW